MELVENGMKVSFMYFVVVEPGNYVYNNNNNVISVLSE